MADESNTSTPPPRDPLSEVKEGIKEGTEAGTKIGETLVASFLSGDMKLQDAVRMASEFNKVTLSTLDENNKAPNYMELVGVAMEQGNSILMAAATEIDAPLRQTIIEGVIQNAPLHEGIANLKGVANSSGLIAAVDNAVAGMREAHEDQRGLMVDMAKGMSANLIKEMNSNPEFAKHFSTLLAVAMTEGANGVGLNKEVAQKVINDAAAIASEAIEKGEKIDYKPSLNIIGEKVLGALEKQSVPATDALKAKQASKGGIA